MRIELLRGSGLASVLGLALAYALLAGCSGSGGESGDSRTPESQDTTEEKTVAEEQGGTAGLLKDSWMYWVASDPSRMASFEQGPTGDAWLAFFHNDLEAAIRGLESGKSLSVEEDAACLFAAEAMLVESLRRRGVCLIDARHFIFAE